MSATKKAKMPTLKFKESLKHIRMDGIPNMIRTKYFPLSLFWFVAFLCCFGTCIYLVFNTLQQYLNFKVGFIFKTDSFIIYCAKLNLGK